MLARLGFLIQDGYSGYRLVLSITSFPEKFRANGAIPARSRGQRGFPIVSCPKKEESRG